MAVRGGATGWCDQTRVHTGFMLDACHIFFVVHVRMSVITAGSEGVVSAKLVRTRAVVHRVQYVSGEKSQQWSCE